MKKTSALVMLFLVVTATVAEEVASCRNPVGKAFYHFDGLLNKNNAGWTDDAITPGTFSLTQSADGSLDLLYVDARNKPASTVQDGAIVKLLRRSAKSLTVLTLYPESTTVLYTFFQEKDGANRFTVLTSRTGDVPFSKSGLLVGTCDPIRFDQLR